MNPHNPNVYPANSNKNNDLFGGYVRNPCAQQSTSQRQHFLPPYPMPMSNNIPQTLMYNTQNQPIYNIMYTHQTMYRNQNTFTNFPQDSWQDSIKTNNYKEKYETKKENCCIDTKNFYNYNKNSILDPQWYYGNYDSQKYTELPSCSQISSDSCCNIDKNIKSVKYCSIQKLPETDSKLLQYDSNLYLNQYNKITKDYPSCSQLSQPCSIYSGSECLEIDRKILLEQCEVPNQYYSSQNSTYVEISKTLDKSDENNGNESDIIVENSEEDSDESEIDKEDILCLLCNTHVENNSYDISLERTVTSFTQTKVSEKLFQILGWITIKNQSKIICNTCMSLLNNLDNLEMQLESIKQKILEKYKTSELCLSRVIVSDEPPAKKPSKKRNFVFKCRVCNKVLSFKKFYQLHMSKHKRKRYKCRYCKKIFRVLSVFKLHIKKHKQEHINKANKAASGNQKEVKLFICCVCGKTFKTNNILKEHENFCSGNLPYKCQQCKKKFPSNTKLNQHLKLFHEKNYTDTCKLCNKGFIKNSELKIHMLSHSSEKSYKCQICGKIYKTISNLNQHKKIHKDKLPFHCEICQKGFLRRENLESHINNHKDNKPYCCTFCDKKFTTQKYLDAHIKIHDGSAKIEVCKVCGKQIKHSMAEHLRIHSNVKNFECLKCLMKFLTKGALAKHLKRKHQIKE